jgi:PII-like signaling protein
MYLLAFYVTENQRHDSKLVHEWLLDQAREMGVSGGSAFRAMAGFGRHGHLHEDTFFELAGELALKIEFVLEEATARQLLQRVREQQPGVLYLCHTVEAGVL